ncbi:sulfur carrier protein ThiS [Cocleimonas sp. KMM 6892]|uniref:sulfur carrier protein ThiS n=1 Tax=unclassified Cocleimonas TaxID=2639732 RepID=UPI002DBC8A6F|nr:MULTISPECIES: sulfur carrier protein ThiS [unclassified Cocleimonas]MEB8433762.1 sulfur carrier protein ThiS [Cocleimonas sp. KMM 6892]MEC4716573.1 sulfur carrier protein ThiS [Cocleimonas sp. KMM 6895]MEC4746272.1 sulfur carrier protein ThiS [Cocleimonas sp. KMM 6896]
MIKVSINNKAETFENNLTISQALIKLGYKSDGMLGVAVNQVFVSRDHWEETLLNDLDKVDILNPVSGG